jgi:hypothetical protein
VRAAALGLRREVTVGIGLGAADARHGGAFSADPSRYRQEVRRFFLEAVK